MNIFRDPVLFIAFGFGTGLAPRAPGTAGTLAAVPIYLLLAAAGPTVYAMTLIVFILGGIWLCQKASEKLGVHDHSGIVWDEIVGLLVTLAGASVTWQSVVAGFALFRLFDIVKPWPISVLDEKVPGGLGIMMDDVLAGVFAAAVLYGMRAVSLIA